MTERPILFSGAMVRALLSGRKTQTRRIVKPGPCNSLDGVARIEAARGADGSVFDGLAADGSLLWQCCPYGAPGDRLWVKETWRPKASARAVGWEITYAADGEVLFSNIDRVSETWRCPKAAKTGNVTPLFMPRWASRITLEVTGVRVERLCDISDADAMTEGCPFDEPPPGKPWAWFRKLWMDINGADSWAANPWVWAISFRRVTS